MRIITALTLLFVFNSIWAQDSIHTEKSLLWEITGNRLEQPSYIFGTIHIIPEEDYFFDEFMLEKLKKCNTLALEADIINMSVFKKIVFAKKMLLPDNTTLSDYMTASDYKKLSEYFLDSLKIKESNWEKIKMIKPIFSTAIILSDLLPKTKTYELELNKIALKDGIDVISLETVDYQFDILNSISIDKQIEMIFIDVPEDNYLDDFQELVEIYKEQDINKMLELYKEEESMTEFEDELLNNRNMNWMPVIEKYINKSSTFIAVGAMHLAGETGLLNLLLKSGYSVLPVIN